MGLSTTHLIILIVAAAGFCVPMGKILQKAGFSWWWSVPMLVPIIGYVFFVWFAFTSWPSRPDKASQ